MKISEKWQEITNLADGHNYYIQARKPIINGKDTIEKYELQNVLFAVCEQEPVDNTGLYTSEIKLTKSPEVNVYVRALSSDVEIFFQRI